MRNTTFALSLGIGALLLATQHAFAGAPCGPHDDVAAHLAKRYGEARRAVGLAGTGGVVEVYVSEVTGTWTITVTVPGGPTCLAATGEGWQPVDDALPPNT